MNVKAFSNSTIGIEGSILLGLAHGFTSSALFICVGGVLYERTGTRLIYFYRGLAQTMPIFSVLFTILCFANCGVPLTLNFVGEFLCLYGAFERLPAEQIRKLLMWDKLPNSGNALKFLIPNYVNSGWTNYSWVISQKMIEKEMGNRGSKFQKILLIRNNTFKEQRVDGSWQLLSGVYNPCLRFTLMGYESNSSKGLFIEQIVSLINHQIKFLSNQINIWIKYSTTRTSRKSIQAFPVRDMSTHTHPNSPRGSSHEVKLGYVGPQVFPILWACGSRENFLI